MTSRAKGLVVLAVQMALVLSVAAKYAWERHTCPMVWTRASQFDPEQPLRGRYLALTLHASACGLGAGKNGPELEEWERPSTLGIVGMPHNPRVSQHQWNVKPVARSGVLTGIVVDQPLPDQTEKLTLRSDVPCEYATFNQTPTEFFIPEHATTPFPLPHGTELWVLVTVPPQGPPRPVELATSDGHTFHVLDLR